MSQQLKDKPSKEYNVPVIFNRTNWKYKPCKHINQE